jgi:hypothetical protein
LKNAWAPDGNGLDSKGVEALVLLQCCVLDIVVASRMSRCEVWDQAFQVLSCSSHEKLFANVLESAQPNTTQANSVLQFAEECFDLSSTTLMLGECCFSSSLSGSLPHRFFHMEHDLLVSAGSAFVLNGAGAAFRRSRSVDVAFIHCGLNSDVL